MNNKKMKILLIPNNVNNNCYRLRNGLPKKYLEKLGHEIRLKQEFTSYMHPVYGRSIDPGEDMDWCDVVVFNRHYDVDASYIASLMKYAKEKGKRVVYETDDMLDIVLPNNPAYQTVIRNVEAVKNMMTEADVCTTTGPEIANKIAKYNPNVRILPNCIVPSEWEIRKGGNKKVRVGWAGGSSHAEDLILVIDVIKELQEEGLDFEFVIFGISPEPWQDHILKLMKKNKEQLQQKPNAPLAPWYVSFMELNEKLEEIDFIHEPFVPLKEYNKKLSELNLDLGICPLVDNEFNNCKSTIKFYEYAMVGTPTLA